MRNAFLEGYGEELARADYKLAYLTVELCPNYPNEVLLQKLDAADFSYDLEWLDVF